MNKIKKLIDIFLIPILFILWMRRSFKKKKNIIYYLFFVSKIITKETTTTIRAVEF